MQSEALKQNLKSLRDYVSGIHELREDNEVRLMRLQLRMIEKSIRQFDKAGIHVPEGVISDKNTLELKIKEVKSGPQEISSLYDELLEIVIQISRVIGKRPDRDIYYRIRESRKRGLSRDILRKSIVAVLKDMGGEGQEREVLSAIGETLKGQLSGSDLERPYGKRARWEMNVRQERKLMIKDGLLTPESIRSKWKLL